MFLYRTKTSKYAYCAICSFKYFAALWLCFYARNLLEIKSTVSLLVAMSEKNNVWKKMGILVVMKQQLIFGFLFCSLSILLENYMKMFIFYCCPPFTFFPEFLSTPLSFSSIFFSKSNFEKTGDHLVPQIESAATSCTNQGWTVKISGLRNLAFQKLGVNARAILICFKN